MPQPVSYNTGAPVSGSIQENNISYVVDGQNRDYRGGFGGLSWMSELPAANNVVFIGNSTTIGKGPANKPLFYPAYNNSAANIIYAANTLPGSPRNFTTTGSAYNWAATNNFFINNSDNPIPRIDADGLVLYVDANQPTSYPQINNTWYDLSGQNNVTNLLNGPAWNSNGWIVFDSTDDYADTSVNTNTLFSSNDPFSVLITIKPTETINANSGLVTNQKYQSEGSPGGFGLVTYNANQVAINLTKNDGTGTVSYEALAPTTLTINSWQNITYTYDPVAGTVTGYKNGTLANSSTSAAYKWTPEARVSWIGRNWQGGWSNDFFSSEISNVSIYRKTLSQSEIKQNYFQSNIVQDGLVFMVDANNLVSYPKSGTTWYNLTGSSGNALFYNGPTYLPQYGGGINRDSTDDFISASISVSTTTNYSVETWFKANPLTGANYNALISAWNSGAGGAGSWELQFYNGVLGVHPNYTVAYTPNTIAHAVYTQNGTETKIYLNGVLQQTSTTSGVDLRNGSIGMGNLSAPGYGGYNLESTFYNVKLYNKTLTSDEVQQNYQATKDKFLGENIITNGLVLNLDAANKDSYPGTGTTWYDLSGNGYNGTLTNGTSFISNICGGCFNFDGVDDYVDLQYSIIGGTGDFTVNQWIQSDASEIGGTTFGNYGAGTLQIFYGTTYMGMWLANDSTYVASPVPFSSNPVMITAIRSGTTTYFYQNGVLLKTGASSANIGAATFRIGTNTGTTEQFTGKVFVTQTYNRALSSTEVTQNYNAQKTRFGL